jgi:hypothetical protein
MRRTPRLSSIPILANGEDVRRSRQGRAGVQQDFVPGGSQAEQPFAMALYQGDAQFLLQVFQVLGDRWLDQAQAVRGAADVEISLHQGDQGAELAQFHIIIRDKKSKFIISHHQRPEPYSLASR